jgi:hypothetical protein
MRNNTKNRVMISAMTPATRVIERSEMLRDLADR